MPVLLVTVLFGLGFFTEISYDIYSLETLSYFAESAQHFRLPGSWDLTEDAAGNNPDAVAPGRIGIVGNI